MGEAGWGFVILCGIAVLAIIRFWGWIDGTDKWERKQKERWGTGKES